MKQKILREGQACRKCGTPVVKRGHKPGASHANRAYYFEWWFACTNPRCNTLYMVEDAKRFVEENKITPNLPPIPAPEFTITVSQRERMALLTLVTHERASARIQRRHEEFQHLTDLREKLMEAEADSTGLPWDLDPA